ncbi:MAG TPA: glutamine synthetase family protein [Steroidobacteraceae bacterium]|nr:glutamine synthetase family protein [Steroidobacteraceae bacterium]
MALLRDEFSNAEAFLAARPAVRVVDLLLPDLCGVLRGKRVDKSDLAGVYQRGMFLPGSMFALDVLGGTIQATGLGFDEGDADRACVPVPNSLYPSPWMGPSVAQLQVQMLDHDGGPFYGDPRHLLDAVLDRYTARGFTPVVAVELEFYLVDVERTAAGHAQPPRSRYTGRRENRTQVNSMTDLESVSDILAEITAACEEQGVPTGAALAECGPNQWEVNLRHVGDVRQACDQAIRFKRIVKGVAHRNGVEATFMAKPYADAPGSGMHLHVSVLDRNARNVFGSEDALGNDTLKQAAAGLLETMADGMAIFAPNANSYRRLRPELYVPMNATWGYNNRGVAVRVPVSGPADRRLEHRVAGADANPYLVAAAVLAGMLHGMERKLSPPPPLVGNAYAQRLTAPKLPGDWPTALTRFGESEFLREYFGGPFVTLYERTRRGEMHDFNSRLTALDYSWYLEQV